MDPSSVIEKSSLFVPSDNSRNIDVVIWKKCHMVTLFYVIKEDFRNFILKFIGIENLLEFLFWSYYLIFSLYNLILYILYTNDLI